MITDQIQTPGPLSSPAPPVGPTPPLPAVQATLIDPQHLPLPPDGVGSLAWWRDQVTASEEQVKNLLGDWQRNLKRYLGEKTKINRFADADVVQVPVDYYKTEQKKAQLMFKTPDVVLTARNPESAAAVPVTAAVLNEKLGPDEADFLSAADECLTDVLCPSGRAWVKVGYTGTTAQVQGVPVVTDGEFYIERGSPAKLLVPREFIGSNYDKADWLAFKSYRDDMELANLGGDVQPPARDAGAIDRDLLYETTGTSKPPSGRKVIDLWYRAHRVDPTVKNRKLVRHLVLVDDEDDPRVHEDSPLQRFDPNGRFVGGVKGLPIKVLTLRYVSDMNAPPSDCAMSRPEVDELSKIRTIQLLSKERHLPFRGVDRTRMTDPADLARMTEGEIGSIILTDGPPNEIVQIMAAPNLPRDTMVASDITTRDIDQTWALGSNQSSVTANEGSKTATEMTLIQQNTDVRMAKEQNRVLQWSISIFQALLGLVQLFADDQSYVEVMGQDGLKSLQAWNRQTIAGEFLCSIKPDSARRLDQNTDRKMKLDLYQLTANDPNNNRAEGLRDVYTAFGEDPLRHLQQPPPPPPEKPRISLSFKAEDLANPMVVSLLQQSGLTIDPQALQTELALHSQHPGLLAQAANQPGTPPAMPTGVPASPPHGGSAQMQEPLNQHALQHGPGGGR